MSDAARHARADDLRQPRPADIFGDVLPDTTRDEDESTEREVVEDPDEVLLRNVPPHHW